MEKEKLMRVGTMLNKLRIEQGYTARELGDEINMNYQRIQDLENGRHYTGYEEDLNKLCAYFGETPKKLYNQSLGIMPLNKRNVRKVLDETFA